MNDGGLDKSGLGSLCEAQPITDYANVLFCEATDSQKVSSTHVHCMCSDIKDVPCLWMCGIITTQFKTSILHTHKI